jgi:hypothetical protein
MALIRILFFIQALWRSLKRRSSFDDPNILIFDKFMALFFRNNLRCLAELQKFKDHSAKKNKDNNNHSYLWAIFSHNYHDDHAFYLCYSTK